VSKLMAIWIDHESALVVTVGPAGVVTRRYRAECERRRCLGGGSRSSAGWGLWEEAPSRAARHEGLQRFYRRVVSVSSDADAIYICGPDDAKLALKALLERSAKVSARIRAVEPAVWMTDQQFVAKAQAYYERMGGDHERRTA
jgi:hypothetical protein